MSKEPVLEVPSELRTIAEQGVEQARKALDDFILAAHKALDDAEHKVDSLHGNARDITRRHIGFVEENIAASFDFAARLAKARTFEEWTRLHTDFAVQQGKRLTDQVKTLGEAGASLAKGTSGKA